MRKDLVTAVGSFSPCPSPFRIPQSFSRSFRNSSTPSNFFTSAKLIAWVARLSTAASGLLAQKDRCTTSD
jgi:hypothetical protein